MAVGGPGRSFHLRVGGTGITHADILPDGPVKEEVVLGHIADLPHELVKGNILDVLPAEGDRPACGVPEAGHQLGNGGFSGAGGPHNGGDLPGAGGKVHIVEDLLLPIIGEAHPVKTEGTLSQLHRLFRPALLRRGEKVLNGVQVGSHVGELPQGKAEFDEPGHKAEGDDDAGQEQGQLQRALHIEPRSHGQRAQ